MLLIDDDPDCRDLIRDALTMDRVACRFFEADSGPEALDFLHRRGRHADAPRPELIYLDIDMPGVSGHDVLRALKADPDLRHIPVVVLTGLAEEQHRLKAARNGAAAFIVKPTDPEAFVRCVAEATRERLGGPASPRA